MHKRTRMYATGGGLVLLVALVSVPALAQSWDQLYYGYGGPTQHEVALTRFWIMAGATGAGFALGWFLSPWARNVRLALAAIATLVGGIIAMNDPGALGWSLTAVFAFVGFSAGMGYWAGLVARSLMDVPETFGSSKWADGKELAEKGHLGRGDGIFLGSAKTESGDTPLRYKGDRHLLTVAPTRSGKGVSHIIPNLLTYEGSSLVIDPKGENAMITAKARAEMGQEVLAVDPWGITTGTEGLKQARFNPLDWLQLGDVDITENAMLLTDALVQPQSGKADPFWREEAKALIQGLLMYVAVDSKFDGKRHLGTLRDLLLLSGPEMKALFQEMAKSPHQVVASTGARSLQKEAKLMANVLASAQAETHMLDSMRLRESLSVSDFKFEDMKTAPMTIYLILPAGSMVRRH